MGEILFIDNDGIEAQVALERVSEKPRTETLQKFDRTTLQLLNRTKQVHSPPASKAKRATGSAKK
jgi:hypothetical protein